MTLAATAPPDELLRNWYGTYGGAGAASTTQNNEFAAVVKPPMRFESVVIPGKWRASGGRRYSDTDQSEVDTEKLVCASCTVIPSQQAEPVRSGSLAHHGVVRGATGDAEHGQTITQCLCLLLGKPHHVGEDLPNQRGGITRINGGGAWHAGNDRIDLGGGMPRQDRPVPSYDVQARLVRTVPCIQRRHGDAGINGPLISAGHRRASAGRQSQKSSGRARPR